jgi:hypothetical protein
MIGKMFSVLIEIVPFSLVIGRGFSFHLISKPCSSGLKLARLTFFGGLFALAPENPSASLIFAAPKGIGR